MSIITNIRIYVWLQIYRAGINMEKVSFAWTGSRNQNFSSDVIKSNSTFHHGGHAPRNNAAFTGRQHVDYKVSNLISIEIFNLTFLTFNS